MLTNTLIRKVNAELPKKPVGNGSTNPYHMICDGEPYVVKFMQNPEGPRALVNEYISANLALMLNLPIAEPAIVEISTELIESSQELKELGVEPGIHFGSKKIKRVYPITNKQLVDIADNKHVIPDILIFDHWIGNKDRGANSGNLLIAQEGNAIEIKVIDHTHVFDLEILWNDIQLKRLIGEEFVPYNLNGSVYSKLLHHINGNNPFKNIINKLHALNESQIKFAFEGLPDEWNCSKIEQEVLLEYLMDRLIRIDDLLPILKPYLPFWKGGI